MLSHKYLYIVVIIVCIVVAVSALFVGGFFGAPSPTSTGTPVATPTPSTTPSPGPTPTGTPSTGVPVYSGSKEHFLASYYYKALNIPSDEVIVKVYFVEGATADEILNWYKSDMAGYEIVEEYGLVTISTPEGSVKWGAIIFKKGSDGVGIWALSGTPTKVDGKQGAVYCVVTGSIEKLTSEKPTPTPSGLPSSDRVSGEEPIPRYPGSVMLSYSKTEGFPTIILIDYGTTADINTVAEWYKSELQPNGWTIKDEERTQEEISLHLVKAQEEVGVIIYAPTSERGYTLISIHYGSYKLPSKDIVIGEEPIERYPGSVMLKRSSMIVGGMKMITITYGTYDSVNDVASWYRNHLTANGWQIVMEQTVEGGKTISCVKEGATIELIISANAYTEIEISYQGTA
ncbi:MAG: hypothetical protein QXW82_05270 [Candidatus Bathyarchaeia archaeon]